MKKLIILIVLVFCPTLVAADKPEILNKVRDKNIITEAKIRDKELCELLGKAWIIVGGQREFFGRLTGVLPREGEKIEIQGGDTVMIVGEKLFVAVTLNLLTEIVLNPSLTPEDFRVMITESGNLESMKRFNEFRERLGLSGDAAD